jgi:hypothetical protein
MACSTSVFGADSGAGLEPLSVSPLWARTTGAIRAFSTAVDPQMVHATMPAAFSLSKPSADWNQLSKLWSWSHLSENRII